MSAWATLRALVADLHRRQGVALWRVLLLMLLASIFDSVGILMLVPMAGLLMGGDVPIVGEWLGELGEVRGLLVVSGAFLTLMGFRTLVAYLRDREIATLSSRYEADLRVRLLGGLANVGWQKARMVAPSDLHRLMWMETGRVGMAIAFGQTIMIAASLFMIQFALVFVLSPDFAMLGMALIVVGAIVALPLVGWGRRRGAAISEALETTGEDGERLQAALKTALAERAVEPFLETYRQSAGRLSEAEIELAKGSSAASGATSMVAATIAVSLLLAGTLVLDTPVALLLPLLVIFARLSGPLQQGLRGLVGVAGNLAGFASLRPWLLSLENPEPSAAPLDWEVLSLSKVRVAGGEAFQVGPVDTVLHRGEWLSIEGASGAGKSLLVDAIAGLLDPVEGAIRVDGSPLEGHLRESWAAGLAYVGQDALLLGRRLSDNFDAAKFSQSTVGLEPVVARLANGLESDIGPGGDLLSGGERQRVAILRALSRQPSLLFLDEATASLDLDAEAELFRMLRAKWPDMAVILVSHRPQSRAVADRRMVLEDGQQVDFG